MGLSLGIKILLIVVIFGLFLVLGGLIIWYLIWFNPVPGLD